MVYLFQGVNIVIILLLLVLPILVCYYLIKYLKGREDNKDELLGRVILLEKRVKELEDYIENSEM